MTIQRSHSNKVYLLIDSFGIVSLTKVITDEGTLYQPDAELHHLMKKVDVDGTQLHVAFSSHCIERIVERFFHGQKFILAHSSEFAILCPSKFLLAVTRYGKVISTRQGDFIALSLEEKNLGYFPLSRAATKDGRLMWAVKSYLAPNMDITSAPNTNKSI